MLDHLPIRKEEVYHAYYCIQLLYTIKTLVGREEIIYFGKNIKSSADARIRDRSMLRRRYSQVGAFIFKVGTQDSMGVHHIGAIKFAFPV